MHPLLKAAAQYAVVNGDAKRAFWLGAIGIRSDGTMVQARNGAAQLESDIGNLQGAGHAETRLARKLDHGATVYVARVRRLDNQLAMAKPCKACTRALYARKVERVYYTISPNEFGVMDL